MKAITELSSFFGVPNDQLGENNDCTDFPNKPCKTCGSTSRPQWRGTCNYDCDPLGILAQQNNKVKPAT
jgi:hypothetical protein